LNLTRNGPDPELTEEMAVSVARGEGTGPVVIHIVKSVEEDTAAKAVEAVTARAAAVADSGVVVATADAAALALVPVPVPAVAVVAGTHRRHVRGIQVSFGRSEPRGTSDSPDSR
jgi:hypothetical protein